MAGTRPLEGVGLGWRPELAADLIAAPETADFLEVVAESCFAQRPAWREAVALADATTVVPHGVKLSLGSADGIDHTRTRMLGRLARDLRAPAITEHVAFTRAGGREIGHLTPLPFTREAIRVLARNVDEARRRLPDVPLLLENVAWTFRWPEDEMDEPDFYAEVVEATGCDLLLDVANLYANAVNSGRDPLAFLRAHPLERVGMAHVAGGVHENGFLLDTHAHPTSPYVAILLDALMTATGALPVILERDQDFPPFAELAGEMAQLRAIVQRHPRRLRPATTTAPHTATGTTAGARTGTATGTGTGTATTTEGARYGERQAELAHLLVDTAPTPGHDFDATAVARTRAVLQHKRVDDALPLLPRLAAHGDAVRAIAFRALARIPRAHRAAGIVDARRIADAAIAEASRIADGRIADSTLSGKRLAAAARRDRLELRARFKATASTTSCAPRAGPFLGREDLGDGTTVWAFKGPGHDAPVRVLDHGGGR